MWGRKDSRPISSHRLHVMMFVRPLAELAGIETSMECDLNLDISQETNVDCLEPDLEPDLLL